MGNTSREILLKRLREGLGSSELRREKGPAKAKFLDKAPWDNFKQAVEKHHAEFFLAADPDAVRDAIVQRALHGSIKWAALTAEPLIGELKLASALSEAGVKIVLPGPQAVTEAAESQMGVTCALAGFLDTGSLVVTAGPDRPRSFSLLPPLHVALLPGSRMLKNHLGLPGLIRSLGKTPSALHIITGSSSTADIELVKVHGVHGPVELFVLGLDWL